MRRRDERPLTPQQQKIADYLAKTCYSIYEGCVCRLPTKHLGPHQCTDRGCRTTWTSAQEREYIRSTSPTTRGRHYIQRMR